VTASFRQLSAKPPRGFFPRAAFFRLSRSAFLALRFFAMLAGLLTQTAQRCKRFPPPASYFRAKRRLSPGRSERLWYNTSRSKLGPSSRSAASAAAFYWVS